MSELFKMATREGRLIFEDVFKEQSLSEGHRANIENLSVDYAVDKFKRVEPLKALVGLAKEGCVAMIAIQPIGQDYIVGIMNGFESRSYDMDMKIFYRSIHMKRQRSIGADSIPRYQAEASKAATVRMCDLFDWGITEKDVEALHLSVDLIDAPQKVLMVDRPQGWMDKVGEISRNDICGGIRATIHKQMDDFFSDDFPDAMKLISGADRFVDGVISNYEREVVRKIENVETGLIQLRADLRGRANELILAYKNMPEPSEDRGYGRFFGQF